MLTPIAVLVVMGIIGAGVIAMKAKESRRRYDMWRTAAEACGLREIEEHKGLGFHERLDAVSGGLRVGIQSFARSKYEIGTQVMVEPLTGAAELRISVEGMGTSLRKGLGTREVELGDATFDSRFFIQGPGALAQAVLDADTRQQVWAAMSGEVAVAGVPGAVRPVGDADLAAGVLTVKFAEGKNMQLAQTFPGALRTVLDAARALGRRRDIPRQLAANALQDPLWAVRLANLATLFREYPDDPATREALRGALEDASEEVRLRAALAVGPDGTATLLDLAGGAAYESTATAAVQGLGARLPPEKALDVLAEARRTGKGESARACLELLRVHPQAATAPSTVPAMLDILGDDDPLLRILAARVLGRVGSVAAVAPLQEAAETFGGELRGAVRQAVAEIQSRLRGATPGQVSLSAAQAGNLSVADEGQSGAVSIEADGSSE